MQIRHERLVHDGPGGLFEGWVCWDDGSSAPRPGVLVAHAFGGQGQFDIDKATALAELGYVGFAADLYGQGRRAASVEEAQALMGELNGDRPLLAARVNTSLAALKGLAQVDPARTAAIGFCFGGKCVLDLARSGADVRGVVSFHGVYDAPEGADTLPIKAAVLALHGWDDPLAPPEAVLGLARELTERGADWQMHAFGHTGHSFTNPRAQEPEDGIAYSAAATARAWDTMQRFLAEVLA